MYSRETEIRHLTSADIYKLGQILDQTNSWKKLMRIIPNEISNIHHDPPIETTAKYNNDHIKLIENASIKQNRMSTEILFDEWGTSGKIRPTIGILLKLLGDAELYRAADFVAESFLNEPPPPRPKTGPAAKIDISIPLATEEILAIEDILNDASCPGTNTLNENAQIASDLINKDFYEKYGKNDKNLDIEYSDFMKFSLNSEESKFPENIPMELNETKNSTIKNDEVTSQIYSNPNQNISLSNKIVDTLETSVYDIPILSALNNDEENTDEQLLPNLSVLNISDAATGGDNRSNSRSGSFGNSSSLSTHTDDDEDDDEGDNLTPNLSILDQKSNDDSSLTNVTDTTSENISFEIDANNDNCTTTTTIDSNIPCLTDLQN